MKKLILLCSVLFISISIANAFTNSLENNRDNFSRQNNNFSSPQSNTFRNNEPQPLIPKEHTGFSHDDRKYVNPNINDTRYNSNCQFGQCIPGGLNPNNE